MITVILWEIKRYCLKLTFCLLLETFLRETRGKKGDLGEVNVLENELFYTSVIYYFCNLLLLNPFFLVILSNKPSFDAVLS